MCFDDEVEPGLEGVEDSGSDSDQLENPPPPLPAGVRKTALRPAAPCSFMKRPRVGDEVLIHYVGTWAADGSRFDSSRDRGEPLRFEVGKCVLMAGWDFGVTTMRVGDLARFALAPEFLHGSGCVCEGRPATGGALVFEVELLEWVSCVDLFGDGSVIKRMEQRPTDRRHPVLGQVCLLGYRLSLAGDGRVLEELDGLVHTIVDLAERSNVLVAGGMALKVGVLNKALMSMRRGERARLQLRASDVLGDEYQKTPYLAEGALLHVELDLREFFEDSDISFERDGSVVKRSLAARDSWRGCGDGGRCTLRVSSVRAGGEAVAQDSTLCFTVGDGQVCDALECAASSMRVGEVAVVTCHVPDMWEGLQFVPACASHVSFHLQLERYEEGLWERAKSDREKVAFHASRKEVGVALFRAGRFRLAAHRFGKVHDMLGYVDFYRNRQSCSELRAQVNELKRSSMLNRALCLLRVGHFRGALRACDRVLEDHCSQDSKALFRRARAHLGLRDGAAAMRDAHAALAQEPRSAEVSALLAQIKGQLREEAVDTGPMYARMCQGLGGLPHPLDVD